jgi:hypothetical protein
LWTAGGDERTRKSVRGAQALRLELTTHDYD